MLLEEGLEEKFREPLRRTQEPRISNMRRGAPRRWLSRTRTPEATLFEGSPQVSQRSSATPSGPYRPNPFSNRGPRQGWKE